MSNDPVTRARALLEQLASDGPEHDDAIGYAPELLAELCDVVESLRVELGSVYVANPTARAPSADVMARAIRAARETGEPVGVPPEAPRMFVVAQTEPLDDGTTPEGNALVDGLLRDAQSGTRRPIDRGPASDYAAGRRDAYDEAFRTCEERLRAGLGQELDAARRELVRLRAIEAAARRVIDARDSKEDPRIMPAINALEDALDR